MMFPKGPRFVPPKISEVPGPNTYTLPEDKMEDYKRGGFLEKTDRFSKDKLSDGLCLPTTQTENGIQPQTKQTIPPTTFNDKYAILQRKLEDLERLHLDTKKAQQAEVERLKLDLARSQKVNLEQTERLDKARKHNDILDSRLQEIKKTSSTDQAAIKDLRVKLRMAEHERTQLSAREEEGRASKKTLQAFDLQRREELRERDRKIADLEKSVAQEKRKRENVEARSEEASAKYDTDIREARSVIKNIQQKVETAYGESERAQIALSYLRNASADQEGELVSQLEQYRSILKRVSEEYGRLASQTVPVCTHERLTHENRALQLQIARLERKLANTEGQVVELTHLIRHMKEDSAYLSVRLQESEEELGFHKQFVEDLALERRQLTNMVMDNTFVADLSATREIHDLERQTRTVHAQIDSAALENYRLWGNELLLQYSIVDRAVEGERKTVNSLTSDLANAKGMSSTLEVQLLSANDRRDALEQQLSQANASLEESRAIAETKRLELEETRRQTQEANTRHGEAVKKERDTVQRLSTAVHQNKVTEDALQAEIEQLTIELADAERYQEAYYSLSDEVGALVARSALVEEEAEKLSKFNAEILGHNNPAQRIMYVDRIRRELAETKHKLLFSEREHEAVVSANQDLHCELAMYKSVAVPIENKPRTAITRVGRPPLMTQSININSAMKTIDACGTDDIISVPDIHLPSGNMMVDEFQ